jgi:hypothetical protein
MWWKYRRRYLHLIPARLSLLHAAALDLHNAASAWNKALLDNAARPSGALVYAGANGANLTDEQVDRLKAELEASFQGCANAGLATGYDFGKLLADCDTGVGVVFNCSFGAVAVPGPLKYSCSRIVRSSAVTHRLPLNDD